MISNEKIQQIVYTIVQEFKPEKVILFGSYASGSPGKNSDLDLLIIKDMELPRHKRAKEVKKLLRGSKVPVDIIIYTQEEINKWQGVKAAFINNVLETGKVLYG